MTGLNFDDLRWLHLLWVVVAVAALGVIGVWQRQRALRRFADAALLPRLAPRIGWTRGLIRLALVVTSLVLLVAALIGPRWGAQTQIMLRRNMDVMILLDVSRSMLARDIAPSRLERAKLAIRDDLLPALGGDRIGLITFAGVPSVACPLTSDYGFFRLALDDVTIRSAPRGGTLIGDAIRRAGTLLAEDRLDSHKIIVLITDGEDHESFPVEAAASVWQDEQIPVIALALGDPQQGVRVPVAPGSNEFVEHEGGAIRSRADFSMLQRVANASPRGVFVGAGTSNFDLGEIYGNVAAGLRVDEELQEQRVRQPSRYHPFAVAALLLVLIDSFLRDGPRRAAAARHEAARRQEAA